MTYHVNDDLYKMKIGLHFVKIMKDSFLVERIVGEQIVSYLV